jgi:hypothetical protein
MKNRVIKITNRRCNHSKVIPHRLFTPVLLAIIVLCWMSAVLPVTPRAAATSLIVDGCLPPPSGMVSWWPGDDNANDIVGVNHGALQNGATFAAGMVGPGFSLDGTNDYVRVPSSASLNPTGSFTLDAWIFPTFDTPLGSIVKKWGDQGDYNDQREYIIEYASPGILGFSISDDAHQNDSAFHGFITPAGVVSLNAWSHVAAVYDQSTGTRRIFVNGVQVAERTDAPITITNGGADFTIGAHQRSSTNAEFFFPGIIDEVEFFNRALSQEEIAAIFNAGSAGKCKDLTPPPPTVCPRSHGHWKNNPDLWPTESLLVGDESYTKQELLDVLALLVGSGKSADASLILARQLIAAKLNILNGSDPAAIADSIAAADALLAAQTGKLPYGIRPSGTTGQAMVSVASLKLTIRGN